MFREDEHGKWLIENGVELLVEPSQEWITINQPKPTTEELLAVIREKRNILLAEADVMVQIYEEQKELVTLNLLTEEQMKYSYNNYIKILIYKQQLRDLPENIPQDMDLNNVVYPQLLLE